MNDDFRDFIDAFKAAGVRFLIVGAHAMAAHGVPRATGDLDVWVRADSDNADRVLKALSAFGAPTESLGISRQDLESPGTVVQIGVPPRRIDLLTTATGLDFDQAWSRHVTRSLDGRDVPVLSRDDLIRNKRATGRPRDLADLDILQNQRD